MPTGSGLWHFLYRLVRTFIRSVLNSEKDMATKTHKPVVDVARDAQCCVHTRDSSCRGQTDGHTDGKMDGQTLCDNKG